MMLKSGARYLKDVDFLPYAGQEDLFIIAFKSEHTAESARIHPFEVSYPGGMCTQHTTMLKIFTRNDLELLHKKLSDLLAHFGEEVQDAKQS